MIWQDQNVDVRNFYPITLRTALFFAADLSFLGCMSLMRAR
jgi:hypothetical protein